MKLNKLSTVLVLSGLCSVSMAQSTVYKCEDAKGVVSYLNEPQNGFTCNKTDLGNIKNMAAIKNEGGLKQNFPATSQKAQDFNQKINQPQKDNEADLKRFAILTKELNDEKSQLATVSNMLKNIPESSVEDFKKMKSLEQNHKRNIETLEQQLAKINPNNKETKAVVNASGLPLNIPLNELKTAISEGNKIGNIHTLPTNQLVIDRVATVPISSMKVITAGLAVNKTPINLAKSAEEALALSNLAVEDAKKQLMEKEKQSQELRQQIEKDKQAKEINLLKEQIKAQEENNNKRKIEVAKIEDELLVIRKRANLLMEERSMLWKKQQNNEAELFAFKKKKEEDNKKIKEQEKIDVAQNKIKEEKVKLIVKNKKLMENKITLLLEQKKVLEEKNNSILKNKEVLDKMVKTT